MTTRELIDLLGKMDLEAEVVVFDPDEGDMVPVTSLIHAPGRVELWGDDNG